MKHKTNNNNWDCWVIVENQEDLLTINNFLLSSWGLLMSLLKVAKKLGLASQQSFLPSLEQFYKSKIKDQIFPRFMLAWFMVACRFALLCSLLISAFVKSVLDIHNANPIYILHFKWFNFLYQCYHTIIYKINKTIHWTFLKGKELNSFVSQVSS